MSEPPPEVVAATSDVPRLGCGRSVDEVWDGLHREPDEHERDCEHCTRAREQLQRLMGVADQAREEEASEASERPRPGLTAQIMDLARTEIRRGRLLPLERVEPEASQPTGAIGSTGSAEGGLAISDIAVMAVVRRAADTVPGVRARRCQITSTGMAGDSPDGGGGVGTATVTLSVELQVAVALGTSIPALTERLRRVITDAIDEHVGVGVDRIDITVGDLYDA